MTRTRGSASKDLGRRAFGTAGGWETSREAPERPGEVIDLDEEILRTPVVLAGVAGVEAPRRPHLQLSRANASRTKSNAVTLLPRERRFRSAARTHLPIRTPSVGG